MLVGSAGSSLLNVSNLAYGIGSFCMQGKLLPKPDCRSDIQQCFQKDFAISASGAEPAKEVSPEAIALLKSRYGIDMSGQRL